MGFEDFEEFKASKASRARPVSVPTVSPPPTRDASGGGGVDDEPVVTEAHPSAPIPSMVVPMSAKERLQKDVERRKHEVDFANANLNTADEAVVDAGKQVQQCKQAIVDAWALTGQDGDKTVLECVKRFNIAKDEDAKAPELVVKLRAALDRNAACEKSRDIKRQELQESAHVLEAAQSELAHFIEIERITAPEVMRVVERMKEEHEKQMAVLTERLRSEHKKPSCPKCGLFMIGGDVIDEGDGNPMVDCGCITYGDLKRSYSAKDTGMGGRGGFYDWLEKGKKFKFVREDGTVFQYTKDCFDDLMIDDGTGFTWKSYLNENGRGASEIETVCNGIGKELGWTKNCKFMIEKDGEWVHDTSFSGKVIIAHIYTDKAIEEACSHCRAAQPVWKHRRDCPLLN